MTVAMVRLEESVQALIDARLDTIDRMLLGRLSGSDRLAIVREVEAQIHDMLSGHSPEELDRDDILAALGRLDPPEAYMPEFLDDAPPRTHTASPLPAARSRTNTKVRMAQLAAIFGLVSLGLVLVSPIVYLIADLLESEILLLVGLFGIAVLAFAGGLTALILGIRSHGTGPWHVVGIVAGAVAGVLALSGATALLVLLAN